MNLKIIVGLCLTLFSSYSYSQNHILKSPAQLALAKAQELLNAEKYEEAVAKLNEVIAQEPNNETALYLLGTAYQGLDQPEKAGSYFTQAKELIDVLIKSNKFNTRKQLEYHIMLYQQRYSAEQASLLKMPNTMKEPVKMPEPINSKYGDYAPTLDPTGTRLYFTSTRPNSEVRSFLKSKKKNSELNKTEEETITESDEDNYYVEKIANQWGQPVKLPEPLNSDNNDGAARFTGDNQMMIFTGCGLPDGIGSCDLYYSTLEGNQWMPPKNLGEIVNSSNWEAQSSISNDGTKIFFASDRCGGYGSADIYMVEKNIFGEWAPPVNLGGIVNTPFTEYSPFFSQDGKTLYFSSDGHPGYGGLDIFKTVYEDGKWSVPVNLGKPLNTSKNDRYFTIGGSGEVGYFASDRGGKGLDLYEIEIPEDMRPQPTIVVTGTVTNAKTNANVGAYVMVEDLNTNELIAVRKSNSATGKYLVVLPAGRMYSVSANKEGFFFYSQSFDVPKQTKYREVIQNIQLKPIEKGTKVVINNIFFETGKAVLTPQSHLELEKAFDLLRANSTMVIEVGGHTDNVGDENSNMKLSHDRAKAVREYLVNRGIPSERIQAKGYGELNPIATNDTDDGRKANRRTEFVILDF